MYSILKTKFEEALSKGSLVFTQSTEKKFRHQGIDLICTYAPALAKKPEGGLEKQNQATEAKQPKSPWTPPEEDLIIETLDNYYVVLNKFAVAKYHFLLVTKKVEPQTALLSERDLTEAFRLLKEANKESGKRHVGFYNCGSASGASVPHKHIQFMTLPDGFTPFPDTTPNTTDRNSPQHLKNDSRVGFSHYIATIASDQSDGEDLAMLYSDLLGKAMTVLAKDKMPISYNLVFTEEWMIITPRKQAKTEDGISLNSLGTIGLLLAKSEKELQELESEGLAVFNQVGFPFEAIETLAPDSTPGYTNY